MAQPVSLDTITSCITLCKGVESKAYPIVYLRPLFLGSLAAFWSWSILEPTNKCGRRAASATLSWICNKAVRHKLRPLVSNHREWYCKINKRKAIVSPRYPKACIRKEFEINYKTLHLVVLMTQKGKYIRRSMSHERANNPKNTLAPSSCSEYLKTLAASKNTSLASWSARTIAPTRKKLRKQEKCLMI